MLRYDIDKKTDPEEQDPGKEKRCSQLSVQVI